MSELAMHKESNDLHDFTQEQDAVRRGFLGRVALENQLDWGTPTTMSAEEVEQHHEEIATWFQHGFTIPTRELNTPAYTNALDLLDSIRSGQTHQQIRQHRQLAAPSRAKQYSNYVERLHMMVGTFLERYRAMPELHGTLPPPKERVDDRFEKLRANGYSNKESAMVLAYEDRWPEQMSSEAFNMSSPKILQVARRSASIIGSAPPPTARERRTSRSSASASAKRSVRPERPKPRLLGAEEEVEKAKAIEAGVWAEHFLGRFEPLETIGQPEANNRKLYMIIGGKRVFKHELEQIASNGRKEFFAFLEANRGLVMKGIRTMRPLIEREGILLEGPSLQDLVDDVVYNFRRGLAHALLKFDYTKGYKFSTYAMPWVRDGLVDAIAARQSLSMSGSQYANLVEARQAYAAAIATPARQRTEEQTSLARNGDVTEAIKAMGNRQINKTSYPDLFHLFTGRNIALDRSIQEDGQASRETVGDRIEHPEQQRVDDLVVGKLVGSPAYQILEVLTDRERRIIMDVYGFNRDEPLTPEEICERYGWLPKDERRWREAALTKMRNYLHQLIERDELVL